MGLGIDGSRSKMQGLGFRIESSGVRLTDVP